MLDNSGPMVSGAQIVAMFDEGADPDEARLDRVFFALSDPVRRAILQRLGDEALLVSELAASRHLLAGGVPSYPGAGAGRAGAAATHRSHQPMQSPRRADFRGGSLDQSLQQVLAGAIRHARGDAGGGFRTAATQAARG